MVPAVASAKWSLDGFAGSRLREVANIMRVIVITTTVFTVESQKKGSEHEVSELQA